ncbi:MAG TPA: APC family permease [Terriglobales bacterium]|nr:APC family permease [Terriglobales bacterium]
MKGTGEDARASIEKCIAAVLASGLQNFSKFFLHPGEFPVISSLRTNFSGISGIQSPEGPKRPARAELLRVSRLRRKPSKLATASAPRQEFSPTVVSNRKKSVRLTLWPLVAATFFMVSGGTYGTEDIVHGAGYGRAILILLLTPILWSLPTAFMIGELSSALPFEGGYYAWVRRAMGNFWGFQEAWLSLVASIFDMAIYPTLFVTYLTRMFPWFAEGHRGLTVGVAVVAVCALLNIAGVRVVSTTSLWLFFALSAPFALMVVLSPFKFGALAHAVTKPTTSTVDILGGLLICMWNYMGWDNASTIATEVERPQRTYPRAMLAAVGIVGLTYILPVAAVWLTGLAPTAWETGSWADIAGMLGGPLLRIALVLGGMLSGFGMFNALVMSYSRLPLAMAQDGMLPRVFAKLHPRSRAPWVAIVVCAIGWATCLGLGFERLVTIDILLYGASLLLEFAALVVLRVREPELRRPFRVPGGIVGAVLVGVAPMLLLGFDLVRSQTEQVLGMSSLAFGIMLVSAGVIAYLLNHILKPAGWAPAKSERTAV